MAEEFLLGVGGPLHRVERAAHVENLRRLVVASIGLTWFPLIVFSLAQWLITRRHEPMLRDLSIHVRLLITLPLLFFAERLLQRSCAKTVSRLLGEGFVPPEQMGRTSAILRSAERWRDSSVPETVLLLGAIATGIAAFVGLLPPAGAMHGLAASRHSMTRIWYDLVSLPIFVFVLWRSLFRWGLWARVLGGLARVPLRLLPAHADRRGGIDFLKRPSIQYGAVLLLAVSCALCGGWATQMILYGTRVSTWKTLLVAFVLIGSLIAFAPLLTFLPQLFAARRRGRREYSELVTDYCRQLEKRWIGKQTRADVLGSPDFQSMADLSSVYSDNVEKMEILLFGLRDVVLLFVFSQLPALPLLLAQLPAKEVLERVLHLLRGGA
jgi:hypothetical protein